MLSRLSLRAGVLSCALVTAAASGQVGLGFGPGIAFQSTHDPDPASGAYFIDGGPFVFEPGAGAWEKTLNPPPGGWLPGMIYTIHEVITFVPDPAGNVSPDLTDWHERIELGDDGNIWDVWAGDPQVMVDGETVPGLMTMFNMSRTEVWFFFDPLEIGPNGLELRIWKDFEFVGDQPMFAPVVITEYPTPAPASAAVIGVMGLLCARRRRS